MKELLIVVKELDAFLCGSSKMKEVEAIFHEFKELQATIQKGFKKRKFIVIVIGNTKGGKVCILRAAQKTSPSGQKDKLYQFF